MGETTAGRYLMFSIISCCATLAICDFYLSNRENINNSYKLKIMNRFIWPSLFGFLYLLAGVTLETGIGIFNELYIMLYCLFVTLTAFIFAFRKNSMSLSVISLLGGIAMPFIIEDAYDTSVSVIYSAVVITGALSLYLYHGWALLLVVSSAAFWGTMHLHNLLAVSRQDTDIIRAIIFFHWIGFWISTTIRERFLSNQNENQNTISPRTRARILALSQRKFIFFNLFILIGCTHLLSSTYYNIVYWAPWGILKGSFCLLASLGFSLWEKKYPNEKMSLVYPNYVVGIVLLSIGIWLGLVGDDMYLALAFEACIIVLVSNATDDFIGMVCGCALWVYILLWSIYVLVVTEPHFAVVNREALLNLFIISLIALQSHLMKSVSLKITSEGILHALCNMWLYREFAHTENYLYFVTALYPAAVQTYAYYKGDRQNITFIRMLFGDLLWFWLFISQTLPRLLFFNDEEAWPLFSFVAILDIFVIALAVQSSLLQVQRWKGKTRWIYLIFCNATLVCFIYRDMNRISMATPSIFIYTSCLFVLGYLFNSSHLKFGGITTITILLFDDYLLIKNTDILWKGTLVLFGGITSLIAVFLPEIIQNKRKLENEHLRLLSRSETSISTNGDHKFLAKSASKLIAAWRTQT